MPRTLTLYELLLKNANGKYNQKVVSQTLILLHRNTRITDRQREDLMMKLFCCVSPVIIKSINNFKMLTKTYKGKLIHDENDLCAEYYMVLYKCVLGADLSKLKQFHYYFNKSLNFFTYRFVQQNYKKHNSTIENTEENLPIIEKHQGYNDHFDLTDIALSKMNLSSLELQIVRMKVEGIEYRVFLKEQKIPLATYKSVLTGLEQKLLDVYHINSDNVGIYKDNVYKLDYIELLKTRDVIKSKIKFGHHFQNEGKYKLDLTLLKIIDFEGYCELQMIDRNKNFYIHIADNIDGEENWYDFNCWITGVDVTLEHTSFSGKSITLLKLRKTKQEFLKEIIEQPTPYFLYNLKD